jgi:aminodeoxyfutalosine deaminase
VRPVANRVVAADWVVPIASASIRAGAVVIDESRVAWIGSLAQLPERWANAPVDQRAGVMTPGLVNAHTHLQYTGFEHLGQRQYSGFEQWSFAFEAACRAVPDPRYWADSALDGARRAVAAGSTVFAEIITNDQARGALAACGATGIEYLEAIGQLEERWLDGARAGFLARLERPGTVPFGISPHAPHSLDGAVIKDLMTIAAERQAAGHTGCPLSPVQRCPWTWSSARSCLLVGGTRDRGGNRLASILAIA